uniref:Uncharacterized protein n=1 Tax=Curvibacter symbiont subsp. Hydra magnipapillata TaxID=667019 RepID=C9YH55_CURXX|nr:hypothetical protein Csp_B21050 [Curvibacter putative symbiont of Hydra magnipapillata]
MVCPRLYPSNWHLAPVKYAQAAIKIIVNCRHCPYSRSTIYESTKNADLIVKPRARGLH